MIFKHTLTFLLIACLSVSVFAQDKKKEGDKKKKEKTFKDIMFRRGVFVARTCLVDKKMFRFNEM